ncbi:hypothetical protein B7494_g6270 [Chlorociboria aeruginascens]|nr:hypothetical protein B7494_g6270 [Chlorociboria aeruginascens]
MPTHKGIQIAIISQLELKQHPEFPHPDSSQFTFRSPNPNSDEAQLEDLLPSVAADSKADRLLGRPSSISVYIPSLAGARFWIRYSILKAAFDVSKWYYFKLLMNGRHIASWGTNSETNPHGQVMHALFEPSHRWNFKDDGVVYKNNGTETRPFFFGNEVDGCSAANDGGLIEILVFRARGRNRAIGKPEEFKNQEKYGIVMPSGGLLEKPQDAKFYNWTLKDPKDDPFITFRFHYRSWDFLTSLHLIPASHPRAFLPPSRSLLTINGHWKELRQQVEEDKERDLKDVMDHDDMYPVVRDSSESNTSATPWLTSVFDDSPIRSSVKRDREAPFLSPPSHPPVRPPKSKFSNHLDSDYPTNSENDQWPEILDRPLPEIPCKYKSPERSRSASAASHTPSIAPSLRAYIDRDTESPEPPAEIGVASMISLRSGFADDEFSELSSVADSPFSPPFITATQRQGMRSQLVDLSPQPRLIAMGTKRQEMTTVLTDSQLTPLNTVLRRQGMASPPDSPHGSTDKPIRKHKRSPTPYYAKKAFSTSPTKYASPFDDPEESLPLGDNTTALNLSESEWMCHTPSPVRDDPEHVKLAGLWSPGTVERRKNRNINASTGHSVGNTFKKRALGWYHGGNFRRVEERERQGSPSPVVGRNKEARISVIRERNWI